MTNQEITNEAYTRIKSSIFHEPKFQELPPSTRYVFICLLDAMDTLNGVQGVYITDTLPEQYGISKTTFKKAIKQLQTAEILRKPTEGETVHEGR